MNTVERWEFTRWSGSSPDAVKNAAMEVARLVYYRQREWPRREWDNIGQLETYAIAQLAKGIYPVLQDAWPQAQPEQPAEQEFHRVFEANESLEESLAEQPEPCVNCRGSGIRPIGDGYSVDACPQCAPEQPEAGRDEAVVDEADFFGCPGYRATYRGKNLLFDPDKETCEFFAEAFNAGLNASRPQAQGKPTSAACSRCHTVEGDCDALVSDDPTACPCRCHEPQVQDESHRICGCEECRGPTPYEAEHPSEGNVGRYYGEAVGANTWDIYRPDGSFLAHIDRPGVFYAILDELNKLNATTRPQAQEAGRVRLGTACGDLYDRRG